MPQSNSPALPDQLANRIRVILVEFQARLRSLLLQSRRLAGSDDAMHQVSRTAIADTIYAIDAIVEDCMIEFFNEWSQELPIVVVAEGLRDEDGQEGSRVFPSGTLEKDAIIRVLIDPIDGTRELMYDKRSAWTIAGAAPNLGAQTRLSDIQVAVMTELPTTKQNQADVLWAIRNQGAHGERLDLSTEPHTQSSLSEYPPHASSAPPRLRASLLPLRPSKAKNIDHGFAMITSFFPGNKVAAGELMQLIVQQTLGPLDVHSDKVFEDQYISTAGQMYELIVGHDRFNADVRPLFYQMANRPQGLCCHPYDCAALLVAQEAGVIITNALGQPLDGPMDTTTGINWAGFANADLRKLIEPVIIGYFKGRGVIS